MARFARGASLLALTGSAWLIAPAAAQAGMMVFQPTNSEQMFTVPANVVSIHVVAIGAPGGNGIGGIGAGSGAYGAKATADLAVTPGEVLYVEVGGPGTSPGPGGFNGGGGGGGGGLSDNSVGGGGGGASDVRTLPASNGSSLTSRVVVAGGGGGGSGQEPNNGGPAGQA
jgi:hypothetical protein